MSHIINGPGSPELSRILREELNGFRGKSVVHAGHYFLEVVDGRAVDHLEEPESTNQAFRDLINFSHQTWSTACRTITECDVSDRPRLIILVNDWQYFIPKESNKRRRESLAAQLRRQYYSETAKASSFHLMTMTAHGLPSEQILPSSESHWLFSESGLRTRFASTVRSLVKDSAAAKQLGLSQHLDGNRQPIISAQSEGQEYPLLYCGNTNCAGEVVELLGQLYAQGVKLFINIYPGQCLLSVEKGTEIARQIFGLGG